jgi:hypothetical protein
MASFALLRILFVLFGKACVFIAIIFLDEVEQLCADALEAQRAAGRVFLDRCRSGFGSLSLGLATSAVAIALGRPRPPSASLVRRKQRR